MRPKRIDYGSDVAFVEAVHEFNRRITQEANQALRRCVQEGDAEGG
jgi:hypothetical protein